MAASQKRLGSKRLSLRITKQNTRFGLRKGLDGLKSNVHNIWLSLSDIAIGGFKESTAVADAVSSPGSISNEAAFTFINLKDLAINLLFARQRGRETVLICGNETGNPLGTPYDIFSILRGPSYPWNPTCRVRRGVEYQLKQKDLCIWMSKTRPPSMDLKRHVPILDSEAKVDNNGNIKCPRLILNQPVSGFLKL